MMHPERRGQTGGQIDKEVAILDGIGIVLFIIPGLMRTPLISPSAPFIRRRVPAAMMANGDGVDGGIRVVRVDPEQLSAQAVADIVYAQTGRLVRFDDPGLRVVDADDDIDGRAELVRLNSQ